MSAATRALFSGREGRGRRATMERRTARSTPRHILPLLGLVALIGGLAVAGAFLALQTLGRGPAAVGPARLGEPVEVPGGLLRVDRVIAESMAPMQADKFARSGMSMAAMGMDMAPKGYRRFTVEVTLVGQAGGGLRYAADQFRLSGQGAPETGPLRHHLGDGLVPAGATLAGQLVFQAPETAGGLLLRFAGGGRAIALDLESSSDDHDHASHDH